MIRFYEQWHIFIASVVAFLILNTIENLIHYNIGRTTNTDFTFFNPTPMDWARIAGTMIGFAILQGAMTLFLDLFLSKKK